jgi:beta-lactamase class A
VALVVLAAGAVVVMRQGPTSTAASGSGPTSRPTAPAQSPADAPKLVRISRAGVFERPAVARFLAHRQGSVTAAVVDARTGTVSIYRPKGRAITASIVKVDILETLLGEAQAEDRDLTEDERELAGRMITESDNDAAEDLWELVGGASAVARYNDRVGLTATAPNQAGYWGLTTTSAVDQVRLVQEVCYPSHVLTGSSRRYALGLMTQVDPAQAWGVSAGVPPDASVALKNGWLPYDGAWHVNSIGCVQGAGRDYVIAVLVGDEPTEEDGIETIEGLSRRVWAGLSPSTSRPHGRRR